MSVEIVNKKTVEQLLNVLINDSAEIAVALDSDDPQRARDFVERMQYIIDIYMAEKNMRQVTEADGDFETYMLNAFTSVLPHLRGE